MRNDYRTDLFETLAAKCDHLRFFETIAANLRKTSTTFTEILECQLGSEGIVLLVLLVLRYTNTQTHKYTDTQIHRHTNTQTHKYTDTQTHRYTDIHCSADCREFLSKLC